MKYELPKQFKLKKRTEKKIDISLTKFFKSFGKGILLGVGILILVLIFLVNVSAEDDFGYNTKDGVIIRTVNNNTYYINGSTVNATSTTCGGTDKFSAFDNFTGAFTCSTDETAAGGGGLNASGTYVYNDSTTIYFNSTEAGITLEVNGSDFWDGLDSPLASWLNTTNMTYHAYNSTGLIINWSGTTGITWAEATNGTLFTTALWNTNYTANNIAWLNTTNMTYHAYNDTGLIRDWNISELIINWSGDYLTLAELIAFSYYNSTDFDINDYYLETNPFTFWNDTYATFNETWADTLYDPLGGSETDPFWTSNFTAHNDTWTTTWAEIDNSTFAYIGEPLWTDNFTAFNSTWSSTYNTTYNAFNSTGLIRDWNVSSLIINWSVEVYTETDPLWTDNFTAFNSTWSAGIGWDKVVNGTLLTTTLWNTNYTANNLAWLNTTNLTYNAYNNTGLIINWSNIISVTGITWANAVNGTLLSQADWDTNYTANYLAWLNTTNMTYHSFNSTGLIRDWNESNYIIDWNVSNLIVNWSEIISATGIGWDDAVNGTLLTTALWNTNYTANNLAWLNTTNSTYNAYNSTGLIRDWNGTGLIVNWSGASGITWADAINGTLYSSSNPFSFYNLTNPPTLDVIGNPNANQTFTMGDNILAFRYTAPTPAGDFDGAFEIEATGGFNGNLVHIHQHTGTVGNVNLLGIEATDTDAIPLEIISTNALAINVSSGNISIISGFYEGDGRYLTNINTTNTTYNAYNSTGLIIDWNATELIINWSGYLATEADPFWTENFTAFNTTWSSTYNSTYNAYNSTGLIIDWNVNIGDANTTLYDWVVAQSYTAGAINWDDALNGTLLSQSDFDSNYTNLNATGLIIDWNADGYIKDWNDTELIINWSSYLTTETDPFWTSNFTAFNATWSSGINWAEATNGTLFTTALWNTNYTANNIAWLNTTNMTYHAYNDTGLIIDWNVDSYIKDWNASNLIIDWNVSELIVNWSNIISVTGITWDDAVNGTLLSQEDFDTNYTDLNASGLIIDWDVNIVDTNTTLYNWIVAQSYTAGAINWANAMNGTLLSQADFDTNYTDLNSTGLIINWSGDYLESEVDPLWTENFTAFNTTWSAGISWTTATNGTLFTTALWNTNYTANNIAWLNTTNMTYHAYNDTGLIIDWNASSYIIDWNVSELIINWSGSNGVPWSEIDNDTFAYIGEPLWTDNFTKYNLSWSSTYNSTYDAYNSTGLIIDWNVSNLIIDWNISNLIINWSGFFSEPLWTANYTAYNDTWTTTWAEIDNSTFCYINEPLWTSNFTAYNSTWSAGIDWGKATNGTLLTTALWNTNYTANNIAWLNTTNLTYARTDVTNTFAANQNLSDNNMTDVQCINFQNGASWCGI